MLNLYKNNKKLTIFLITILFFVNNCVSFADEYSNQIDSLRQDLNCIKSKTSSEYIQTKQKLDSLIKKTQKDYSDKARLKDCKRLINEEKYNAALYELYDLIQNNKELSKSNEYLGDISYKTSSNYKNASYYYKKAMEYDSKNGSAAYKLGCIYLKNNDKIDAIDYFKIAAENTDEKNILFELEQKVLNSITPKDNYEANMLYEILGDVYTKQNKVYDAAKAYYNAIEYNPDDIFIKYSLANLYYDNNKNENALSVYNSILKDMPNDTQIMILKAKSLAKSGNLLGANREYLNILKRYPNSKQAKYGIYKIYQGKINPSRIIEKMNANTLSYKANAFDLKEFAKFLDELGDKEGKIAFENEAKKYIVTQPKKQAPIIDKTPITLSQNKIEDEKTKIEKENKKAIIDKQEQEKIKKAKAKKELERRQFEDKMIEIERAKAQQKDKKQYDEYKKMLNEYLQIEPKTSKILVAIANTYKLMDEPTSALRYYRQAIEKDPTNSDIYYNLGLTYMELNNFEEAKIYLQKSIGLDSENKKAANLLAFVKQKLIISAINSAYAKFEQKDYISSYEILENNIKKYPENPQLYYYRALVYDAMKRNSAQIADLNKAIELDPSYYMAYYQLAKAYEKVDDERNALIIYERFLSTEPDEKDLVIEVQKKVEQLGKKYY